jgi:hypothetical protein
MAPVAGGRGRAPRSSPVQVGSRWFADLTERKTIALVSERVPRPLDGFGERATAETLIVETLTTRLPHSGRAGGQKCACLECLTSQRLAGSEETGEAPCGW